MITYALDYETYYDKNCSIRTLGPLGYFSHPDFDCYMVSVVGDNGYEFVGHPKDFDWDLLIGNIVLSHNASFDQTLYKFGVSEKWWPEVAYDSWHCTADMAAYCGLPRNLAGSCKYALGIEPDKTTRTNMLGKQWDNMTPEFQKEVLDYAIVDSELCLKLWQKLQMHWPDHEKEISRVNREALQNGIPIDLEELKVAKERVHQRLFEAENAIPWFGEAPTLSRPAFNDECRKMGIEPPASLAKDNLEAQQWIKKHGQKYKWITAVGEWRRINSMLKKLEAIDKATMPDGRYYGNILYWGAHTGRFSGGGGNLNLQNLPRKSMFGADLRKLIKPPAGKKLVVVDLSQIEVRTLLWLAKDKEMLETIKSHSDIYEAFAIAFGMWETKDVSLKEGDPSLRHIVKAMVLGCGFGAGSNAFSAAYGVNQLEAQECINKYRSTQPKVVGLWKRIKGEMKEYCSIDDRSVNKKPFAQHLPLRDIKYGKLYMQRDSRSGRFTTMAILMRNSKPTPIRLWQGLVTENLAQGLARDIFAHSLLEIEKAGYKILFHVHDEVIVEVEEGEADDCLDNIISIMRKPPKWIDLPLDAEGSVLDHYEK